MKNFKSLMVLMLIIALVFAFPAGAFAKNGSDDPPGDDSGSSSSDDSNDSDDSDDSDDSNDDNNSSDDSVDDSSSDDSGRGSDDPPGDDSRSGSDDSIPASLSGNSEYMALVNDKNVLSDRIDAVKDQLDAAEDSNDSARINQLENELRSLKNQKDAVEAKMFQLGGADRLKPFDDSKRVVETELTALKNQRDAVERELLRLRTELSALGTSGSASAQDALRQAISEQQTLKDTLQTQISQKKLEVKNLLRNLYSDDEWHAATQLQLVLDQTPNMQSLPLNSILLSGKSVKLDTPPVILAGRTLIPVRAIATALGATVLWDEREQKITIQQGSNVVEFELGDDSMKVNGNSIHLDVPAQIINGRTVIPLRAMAESLGLTAEWDSTLQIIELQ